MIQRLDGFAEESAEVEVLLASLDKTKDLSKRIKSSLTRLDTSGKVIKEAIGPINSNSQFLQTTARNVDRLIDTIERVRQPLDSKGQEENIIKAGPNSSGLQQYLGALRRIDKALGDLSATNIRSNQQAISDYHALLTTGVNQLQDLYRTSIDEDSVRVEPLHYVTKQLPFPTFAPDKATHLTNIASAIVSASAQSSKLGRRDDDPAVRIYSDTRGAYISSSLQNLATASVNTSKRGPADTSIYKQGTSGVGTYSNALEGMLLAEYENVSRVFRGEVVERVYTATCSKALSEFSKTLSELNNFIKGRIMTDCFLAYELIDLVTPMSYRLESKTRQLRAQISDAIRPVRDTARSSLIDIISRTRQQADALSILPPDGNTIPLAHDTAARLRTLALYASPLSSLLTSLGDNGWRKDPSAVSNASSSTLNLELTSPADPESSKLLSSYLNDLLDTLITSLNAKSQVLHRGNKTLQGVFILNTIAVVSRSISSSPELAVYVSGTPNNPKLEAQRKAAASAYTNAWREPSQHLLDTIHTSVSSGGSRPLSGQPIDSTSIIKSLSSKDKDKIKEKFRNFNTSFDECVVRHKSLYMEKEVRDSIGKDIQSFIEPLYGRFWDRYHEVDKGRGKVVKYTKAELVQLLAGL